MALGGRVCPFCRFYNPVGDRNCGRCRRVMPPPFVADFMRQIAGVSSPATKLLIAMSVAVFVVEVLIGKDVMGSSVPVLVRSGALFKGSEQAEPWRLVAACFVHIGALHLLMNMSALWDLGRIAEDLFGSARIFLAFFVTGVGGFLVSKLWYDFAGTPYITAGASGAIFGVNGVLLGELLRRRDERWKGMLLRTIGFSFVFYFVMRTNQAAHLGGLAIGLLLGVAFGKERNPQGRAGLVFVLAAVALLASVASLIVPQVQYRSLDNGSEEP